MEADSETRAAKSELLSLQSSKEWYQQQLELATRARSELQKDLTLLQAQASSQSSIIERLKTENTRLRQQFTDIQNRALKEKEILAKHLEAIESDMMDREAAFQEIQRERSFLEDAFSNKIQTAEDEKNRISLLMQMTNDLENQLEKAHVDLKKKQNQIVQLENENIELMKKLNISQETVSEKENVVEELKHDLIKLEDKLKAFQKSIVNKDTELLKHKEEKAKIEIALNAALQEKESVDKSLDNLKSDMGKVEKSFKMMRQELNSKSAEVHTAKSSSKATLDHIETLKTDLENERRKYELAKSEFGNKNELLQDLQGQKINLESEVTILREKIVAMEASHDEIAKDKQILDSELNATREKLEELKMKFEAEAKTEKGKMQLSSNDNEEYAKMQEQQESLREKLAASEKDSKKDLLKQKARVAKLNQDLNAVKTELMERQKTFDDNIEVLSEKLREMALEKDKLETELTMTHRKYEFSMLEQKDQIGTELQNLASELQQVRLEKQELKSQYMALQHARDQDLHQYQQQLEAMGEELRLSREMEVESTITVEANQALQLELEKEKGRLAGLMQSNATLKHHVSQLEEALASRESTLVEMQTAWGEQARTHERSVHENLRRVQVLEESLKMEKDGQRDLRKQIGIKITENKKLKRQNDGLKQDVETLRQDLAQRVQEVGILQGELETSKQNVLSHQSEMAAIEAESKSIQRELERVQQQLRDSVSREPVILEQIKGLEWKLELKSRELTAVQEQLAVSEERQLAEMGAVRHLLQVGTDERQLAEMGAVRHLLQEKTGEIENLKMESSALKHDKQSQQAKLSELRSALKSSIHYHKLTKKFVHLTGHVGEGDSPGVELPPLPFDLEDMDRLLQETTVRALESKPLDNLQNCLLNLRSEISGLQSQMEVHSTTIQSSNHSWSSIEQQVQELCTVVQTLTQTSAATATTDSLAAAAVDMANGIINI
ncbi:hypothetical protein DPMN_018211 [Dreissena polymorpha]|uniref:Uncharacterized protein n=1 Tax=Dreissena polymorpha TaxID=45954 RepID=A0A9D4NHZ8_DREPO|nr:hypothetical protein DPMN_018211 [Dreissena polymorpha]